MDYGGELRMNPIIAGAAIVTAIGTIGGGAMFLDHAHVASGDFSKHLSEQRVQTIFSYMDQIKANGAQEWLCRALEEELIYLCTELPQHAMCRDGANERILNDAGC